MSDCAALKRTLARLVVESIGEAPIKGLIDPRAMARVTLGSPDQLAFANTTGLKDIKYSETGCMPPIERGGRTHVRCVRCVERYNDSIRCGY